MYGLPQAAYLSNKHLVEHLATQGYIQDPNVPCLFAHLSNGVAFTLIVDDFGVKYSSSDSFNHLVSSIISGGWKLKTSIDAKEDTTVGDELAEIVAVDDVLGGKFLNFFEMRTNSGRSRGVPRKKSTISREAKRVSVWKLRRSETTECKKDLTAKRSAVEALTKPG